MTADVTVQKIALPGRWGDPDFHLNTCLAGSGPPVVFVHGFPDLAMGWEHQLASVAAAGFQCIAPDMRGYGGSSCPRDVAAYDVDELTGDLVALMDSLGLEQAVFVGHDWGGFIVWAMPVLYPERVAGVAAACTPYMPFPGVAEHLAVVEGDVERQYVAWFQEAGVAESYMDRHVEAIMRKIMRRGIPLEEVINAVIIDGKLDMNPFFNVEEKPDLGDPFLDEQTLSRYVRAFESTGFRGGINWYRNIDRNAQLHPEVGVKPLDLPCLMMTADLDPALRPEFAADMPERCNQLEMHLIEGAGHWVQQEKPEELNAHLVRWLQEHFS